VGQDEGKRTNEITMAAPLLDAIEIRGKTITADALLTQRAFATYLVDERQAHYHFTVKGNQPTLRQDLVRYFEARQAPDFVEATSLSHGRIETRKIWITQALNASLPFPHVGQAFVIERERLEKTTGELSTDVAYGITSRPSAQAQPQQVLQTNRGHWSIENSCHYILDWNWDEDRSRIRTGHGPENVSRLRRLAITLVAKPTYFRASV
jgi:predicted transposase YbfD/YdcC